MQLRGMYKVVEKVRKSEEAPADEVNRANEGDVGTQSQQEMDVLKDLERERGLRKEQREKLGGFIDSFKRGES